MLCFSTTAAKVIFEKEAGVYTSQGTLHASMEVDLTFLFQFCTSFDNRWEEWTKSDWKGGLQETFLLGIKAEVTASCEELHSWGTLQRSTTREKRQLLALLGGTVFGALVAPVVEELFHTSAAEEELAEVRRKTEVLTEACNLLMGTMRRDEIRTSHALTLSHQAAAFSSLVGRYTRAYAELVTSYRLSPPILHVTSVEKLWREVEQQFNTKIQYPPEAAYELPASYHFNRGILHVVLHLPLLGEAFQFHRLHPFPLGTSASPFFLMPPNDASLLAVSMAATSYFEMGLGDLTNCLQLGHVYVCPDRILQHDFGDSCLAALFAGLDGAAHHHCVRQDLTRPWALGPAKGGSGWFHLFLNQSLPFTTSCRNGSRTTGVWNAGTSSIYASPSCTIACSAFSVQGNVNRSATVTVVRDFGYRTILRANETFVQDKRMEISEFEHRATHHYLSVTVLAGSLALSVATIFAILGCIFCRTKPKMQQS